MLFITSMLSILTFMGGATRQLNLNTHLQTPPSLNPSWSSDKTRV